MSGMGERKCTDGKSQSVALLLNLTAPLLSAPLCKEGEEGLTERSGCRLSNPLPDPILTQW